MAGLRTSGWRVVDCNGLALTSTIPARRIYTGENLRAAGGSLCQPSTARRLSSKRYSDLREELVQFLEYWDQQEPDKLKVLSAVIRSEIEAIAV